MKLHDILCHTIHRHEPPVLDQPIHILRNLSSNPKEGIYAVNKPPSLPVHPCGSYNFNSLIRMLTLPPISMPLSIQRAFIIYF